MSTIPFCFLHGWAANGRVFRRLQQHTAAYAASTAPDLPGHGSNPAVGVFDPASVADSLAAALPGPVHLLGWSLGSVVAIQMAVRHPHRVHSLSLCAGFAKFRYSEDYPVGVKRSGLDGMLAPFSQNYAASIRQFLELQLLHHPDRHTLIDDILPDWLHYGTPDGLAAAWQAVENCDVRSLLPEIRQPVLLLYGGKDALTPLRMGEYLAAQLPQAQLTVFPQAAHTPFLSHETEFVQALLNFTGHRYQG